MRLQAKGPPDAHDGILVETAGLGHGAGAPVRRVFRAGFQRAGDHRLDFGIRQFAGLAGAGRITQGTQSSVQKTLPPLAHRREGYPPLGRHGGVAQTRRTVQDNPRSLGRALTGFRTAGHEFKLGLFVRG